MTASTDDKSSPAKPPKKLGPIRTGAVVPTLIVLVLCYIYFHFFFDNHLRKGIEWTAGYVHGAEVDVAKIETSVFGGSFLLAGLQVTDKDMPSRNLFSLGEIRFRFTWDALLRLKFVVDEAAIETIEALSPRKTPGWVKPPEPPSNKPSMVDKIQQNALAQAQSQFGGSVLGDAAKLLGGTDSNEILKSIQNELKAEKFITNLQATLKEKEKFWKDKINNLPKKEDFEALQARAKALKFNAKDPSQFAKDLKEMKAIVKEADAKIDEVKSTGNGLKTDTDTLKNEIGQIDDLIKQDIKDIENHLKIGKLDVADFSKDLFGRMFGEKIASVQKYATVAKQYLPPPKDPNDESDAIVPRKRGEGENIRFPVKGGYPLFWLKRAGISSKASAQGFSGNLAGELTDVSTDPKIVPNPLMFKLAGNFPNQKIDGLNLVATLDHRNVPAKQSLDVRVGSYPISEFVLSPDPDAKLALKTATGAVHFLASLESRNFIIRAENEFSQLAYDVQAKNKILNEALTTILGGIPKITLNATAEGTFSKFETHLNSNLGRELSEGMQKFVKAKVDEMKAKIKAQIDDKIKGKRAELETQFQKIKDQVDSVLKEKKAEVDKAKDAISTDAKAKESGGKEDLKKKGKELLKKFKF